MKNQYYRLLVALALCVGLHRAAAQGTAFTYQGRLQANSVPANGSYDFQFSLFSAASGGGQVGTTQTQTGIGVTNGLFTTTLDFGGIFSGSSTWLAISVRTNGVGTYAPLTTRQALNPTPYAIYAESAGSNPLITDPGTQNFFAGTSAGNQSSPGTYNTGIGFAALNVNTGSYNSALGNDALAANTSGDANTADGVFALWKNTTGGNNAAFGADAMAFNTTGLNNTALGQGALEDNTTGSNNVAVGALAMNGATGDSGIVAIGYQALENDAFTPGGFFGSSASVAVGYQALQLESTGGFNTAVGYQALNQNTSGIENTGLGIEALYNATGNNNIGIGSGAGNSITGGSNNIEIGNIGLAGDNNTTRIGTDGTQTTAYISGNLGLGGATPQQTLSLNGGINVDQSGLNIGTAANALTFGSGSGEGVGSVRTSGHSDSFGLDFYTDYHNRMTIKQNGNVGIGTTNPSVALEVAGEYLQVDGLTPVNCYIGDDGVGNDVQIGSRMSGITAVSCYNSADSAYMHFYCSSITIKGGADLAEPFKMSKAKIEIPQGAVVVIDPAHPGQLKMSDKPYDTCVAGVVSGANGIHPGIELEQQGALEGGKNVALTGRVYVQADATMAAIEPGDLLTTSSTPGHAMKVTKHARSQGAILGKAMTELKGGKGMVLVLVTLQ